METLRSEDQDGIWQEEERLRQTLEEKFREELGENDFYQKYLAVLHAIELEMRRRRWESGKMPREYESRLPFMYAHAYVYALDSFQKILEVLVREPGVPPAASEALEKFKTAFPVIRGIRDSAHHIEDRGRGVNRHGIPLELKPLHGGMVHAPAGAVLLLSNLRGNNLGYTVDDGSHREIAVSYENTAAVAEIFQSVIDAFQWKGRPRLIPSS